MIEGIWCFILKTEILPGYWSVVKAVWLCISELSPLTGRSSYFTPQKEFLKENIILLFHCIIYGTKENTFTLMHLLLFFFNVQLAMPCGKKVMNYITWKSKLPRLFFLVPDDVRWAICYHLSTLSLMFLWQVTQCILEQANLMFPYSHSDLWTQVTKVTQYALLLDCLRFQPLCKNKVQAQMLGYSAMVSVSGS